MMISFCRKITPHSFLGLTTTTTTSKSTKSRTSLDAANHEKLPLKCSTGSGGGGLLGLVTAPNYDIVKHQSLVLESSSIKSSTSSSDSSPSPPSTPPPSVLEFEIKKDPGKIGFIDDIGGGVDGLMSCTESLGFESSDERRVGDHLLVQGGISHFHEKEDQGRHEDVEEDACLRMMKHSMKRESRCTRMGERKLEANKFPPPLSSLNQNGQPRYYLRPVRKDGRLELTEVRIYRPEIMRAYREDGRLRLHLVSHEPHDLQEEEEEVQEEIEGEVIDEEENIINVKEEESVGGDWKLKVGGEGFRRCQNLVSRHNVHHQHNHHHGNLPVWSQQQHCVTTR